MIRQREGLTKAKWDRIKACNHPGKVVEGQVVCKVDGNYLVHVRSGKGAMGYLRNSEAERTRTFVPNFSVEGQCFKCTVKSHDNQRQRIELSLENLYSDRAHTRFLETTLGSIIEGTVVGLYTSGCFVRLQTGVTAFLPVKEIPPLEPNTRARIEELVHEGDRIRARVVGKDQESGRLKLSVNALWSEGAAPSTAEGEGQSPQDDASTSPTVAPAEIPSHSEKTPFAKTATPRRVLVIEDDVIGLETMSLFLKQAGHEVFHARDLEEVPAVLDAEAVDCIVSDLFLEESDNVLELLVEYLTHHPQVRLVIVTGYFEHLDRETLAPVWNQILDIMVKPLDYAQLLHYVATFERADQFEGEIEAEAAGIAVERWQDRRLNSERADVESVARQYGMLVWQRLSPVTGVAVVKRIREESREFDCLFAKGIDHARFNQYRYDLKHSPVGDVMVTGKMVHEQDVTPRDPGRCEKLIGLVAFNTIMGFPLRTFGAVRYGLFVFRLGKDFSEEEEIFLESTAARLALDLEKAEFQARITAQHTVYSLGNLLAGMSHEVANHMNNVLGSIEALGRALGFSDDSGVKPKEAPDHIFDNLRHAAGDVANVVKMFLGLTRSTQSVKEEMIAASIQEVVHLMAGEAARQKVKLSFETPPPEVSTLMCPQVVLRQTLFNLTLNALQHANSSKGAERSIHVHGKCEPQSGLPIQIRVVDTGHGIHRDWWERVFDPFFTTRPDGTGLGLYIVRTLVEGMGGRISVEDSCLFGGTTMLLELPNRSSKEG